MMFLQGCGFNRHNKNTGTQRGEETTEERGCGGRMECSRAVQYAESEERENKDGEPGGKNGIDLFCFCKHCGFMCCVALTLKKKKLSFHV